MTVTALLTVDDLHAGYGRIPVLRGVSLHVDAGEFVAVLGANGAGKSTLLKAIMGLTAATAGKVRFGGQDLGGLSVARRIRLGIGVIPEGRQLFSDLTVIENLALGLYPKRTFGSLPPRGAMDAIFELLPALKERSRQLAGSLSGGEAQMLTIGRALIARPKLLLCDEPSLGLAPLRVAEMFETLDRVRRSGVTILLADQNANAALRRADRAYIFETGAVVASGSGSGLLEDDRLGEFYLSGPSRPPADRSIGNVVPREPTI